MKRQRGEAMSDYINRFEKCHDYMIKARKKTSSKPDDVHPIDKTILAWWLVKRAGLEDMQKSVVVSSAGNKHDWAKVTSALRAQWTKARTGEVKGPQLRHVGASRKPPASTAAAKLWAAHEITRGRHGRHDGAVPCNHPLRFSRASRITPPPCSYST